LPERVSIPSYMKDVYAYTQEPGRTLTNKISPLLNLTAEMLENRNFYDTQIRNPDDPLVRQAADIARFIGTNVEPFAVRGFEHQGQLGEPLSQRLTNFIGVQPAPTYLNKTPAEKLADQYREQSQRQGTRTSEQAERAQARAGIVRAMRMGQNPKPLMDDAISKGLMTGRELPALRVSARLTPLQLAVRGSGLTLAQALDIYEAASPAERQDIQRQVRLKVMNARNKPWEWNQKTTTQAQKFFGIAPGPPAALLRMPGEESPLPQVLPQNLPQDAKGGVVTKPTIGILAEREPEAVVPVKKLAATKAGRKLIRLLRAKRIDDAVVA